MYVAEIIIAAVCLAFAAFIYLQSQKFKPGQWVDLRGLVFYNVSKINERMCFVTIFQEKRYVTLLLDEYNADWSDCRIASFTTHMYTKDARAHIDRMIEIYKKPA